MAFSFRKPLRWLACIVAVLLVVTLLVTGWAWWRMRASLPPLDGTVAVSGLSAPVQVERDALGVPTITGATRADVARALGFLHAQDRYFQMDLLRRSGAGELSELFGSAALPLDKSHRLHGFRATAVKAVALLPAEQRTVLDAYTAGVNAGLAALPKSPWEYVLLRTTPQPWLAEDSLLVAYAMWFDLQDATGRLELGLQAMRATLGQTATDFFAPRGNSWDAALDGSLFPEPAMPRLILERPENKPVTASLLTTEKPHIGSNNFAVAGRHGQGGQAFVANDMHLNLNLPHIWYRAVMRWTDTAGTAHRVVGVTLPGVPTLVVGSNGSVAWGYTNSYVDTVDVVTVEVESIAQTYYRTPHGFVEIEHRPEIIPVKGEAAVTFDTRWTEWGPIIGGPVNDRFQAVRWTAHDPESTNLTALELERATTVGEAVAIAHRMGMPNQNLVVADRAGEIAWTLTGRIPKRIGFDGRYPVSWAYGDRRWDGWLPDAEIPVILNPAEGLLWTANQRLVGGDAYAKLGDNGYDDGPRGRQIRDDLRQLVATGKPATPAELLGVMLDDRAVFLTRWQELLASTLSDEAVAQKGARSELRDAVRQWNGHASVDSAAYLIVRSFRSHVARKALEPFIEPAKAAYAGLDFRDFLYDDALWRLTHEQPAKLLNPKFASWEELLLSAADDVLADIDKAGKSPANYTWGSFNQLRMRHPFSRVLPGFLSSVFDMPVQPLPGAADMPRVQGVAFGQSERLVVSPGHEDEGLFHMPGGQSGHPLSPYYRAGHNAWVEGQPTPLLPGATEHTLTLTP
jgi:penicillin amidase